MSSLRKYSILVLFVLLSLHPSLLMAAWPLDGAPIFTVPNEHLQGTPVIIDDGEGGAIIAWCDERNGNRDIFAQKVDHQGNALWSADGVVVCNMTGIQSGPCAVSDGAGGAIIAWSDYRGGVGDIYAQRIDADGNRLWLLSGSAICSAVNNQYGPEITTDGAGGAIIAWHDNRSGLPGADDIYVRRVDSDGNVYWTILGVPVCTDASTQRWLQIASDGNGGAYMAWYDSRNGNNDIFCELVYSNGSLAGGADGYGICTDSATQLYPHITELGPAHVLISWHDSRNGDAELFAQNMAGFTSQWAYNGIQVATSFYGFTYRAVKDDDGCVVFCWNDHRNGDSGIFAQRLLMTGVPLWSLDGVTVCDSAGDENYPAIVSDATGGTIIVFHHNNGLQVTARAQRLDGDGTQLWDPDGVRICTQPHSQYECIAVPDGKGGAITAWKDYRSSYTHIYAQRIDRHGYPGSPEPVIESASDVPLDQGGKLELTWDASYLDPWPYQEITYYSIWKSLSPASAMMMENEIEYTDLQAMKPEAVSDPGTPSGMIIRRETVGAATYYWELLETQPAQYYEGYSKVLDTDFTSLETAWTWSHYQVAAHAVDPLVVWASQPDSGYSLDNLAPASPVGLGGEQYYSPEGMGLFWNMNLEEDLSHYTIYRGIYPTFVPDATSYLTSAFDTMYFDGGWDWDDGYVYKVSATDIHGNESGYALLLPGQVTGDDPPTPSHSDYLSQNWPNPFNPSTTIQFGLKESGHIRLSIYDASGRLVSELVNSTFPAGSYSEIWNGTNSSGAYVASGVYFYRIDADEFSMKKKMILLR